MANIIKKVFWEEPLMYIKKIKKIIYIYCEGVSEKNYFEALKGNVLISRNYVLKPNSKENDLKNAIKKSKKLEGLDITIIYIYDSDTFKQHKKITQEIEIQKKVLYFNEENFEDFLNCHKTKPIYRKKKPNLNRHLIEEIRNLDSTYIKKHIKKPNKFKKFKSIYDLLIELFDEKI